MALTLPSVQTEETSLHCELCLSPRQPTRTFAHFLALVLSLNFLEPFCPLSTWREGRCQLSLLLGSHARKKAPQPLGLTSHPPLHFQSFALVPHKHTLLNCALPQAYNPSTLQPEAGGLL